MQLKDVNQSTNIVCSFILDSGGTFWKYLRQTSTLLDKMPNLFSFSTSSVPQTCSSHPSLPIHFNLIIIFTVCFCSSSMPIFLLHSFQFILILVRSILSCYFSLFWPIIFGNEMMKFNLLGESQTWGMPIKIIPSIHIHDTTWELVNGFSWYLIWGSFINICQNIAIIVEII